MKRWNIKQWDNPKLLAVLLSVFFALSLVPVCIAAFYASPAADDYYYSIYTHQAVLEGGSPWQLFLAALRQVTETYTAWQGTFSAVFLFALQPGIFGTQFYALTTFFLLAVFLSSSLFLGCVIFQKICRFSRSQSLCFTLGIVWLQLQFLPSPVQGLYWWNGAIYYVFFYSLGAVLIGLLLLLQTATSRTSIFLCFIFSCPLTAILSGGNYVTALLVFLSFACFIIYALWKKQRRKAMLYCVLLLLFFVGFAVSALSPGNHIRALSYPDAPNAIVAVIQSLGYALQFVARWSSATILFFAVLCCAYFYRLAKKTVFSFRHPLLVLVGSFLLFAAQFTPPVYAMNSYGADRILNIIYFGYVLFLFGNACYLGGYLAKHRPVMISSSENETKKTYRLLSLALSCCFFLALPLATEKPTESYLSTSALETIVSGSGAQFAQECEERIEALEDPEKKKLIFRPFTATPRLLFYADLTADPDYEWTNRPIARYYEKDSVIVDWS